MYEVFDNELKFGLFLQDNPTMKIAEVVFTNLENNQFTLGFELTTRKFNSITPYARTKFAGRFENSSEDFLIGLIKQFVSKMEILDLPELVAVKEKLTVTLKMQEVENDITVIRDYTDFAKGTWVIIDVNNVFPLNVNVTWDAIVTQITNILA